MFQAGTLLKIWLLSATVTLGILAVVDLAETTGQEKLVRRDQLASNALHRRAPKPEATQTPISAQCGNSFNNQEKKDSLKDDEVACTGYGDRQFKCKKATCEIRNHVYYHLKKPIPFNREYDEIHKDKEKDNYQYHDCEPQFGQNKKKVSVYPVRYWAHNHDGNLYVEGYQSPTSDKKPRFYICKWQHIRDQNNQRPWCDECVKWKFEQRLIPASST